MVVAVVKGVHGYQLGRTYDHAKPLRVDSKWRRIRDPELVKDPFWDDGRDWTAIAAMQTYGPMVGVRFQKIEDRNTFIPTRENTKPVSISSQGILRYLSHDFAVPVLDYLKDAFPEVYRRVLQNTNLENGIAQLTYYHSIPAFETERVKQVLMSWEMQGYNIHHRFNPHIFWSPEGSYDYETFRIASDLGYKSTVFAPRHCHRIRKMEYRGDESKWEYVGESVDPSKPYRLFLGQRPDGTERFLDVFFYDGHLTYKLSRGTDGIYSSGQAVIDHIKRTRQEGRTPTYNDIETWDHQLPGTLDPFAFAVEELAQGKVEGYRLSTYWNELQRLNGNPPDYEVQCHGGVSWSCEHIGFVRWGGNPHWGHRDCDCDAKDSTWRRNLRAAFLYLNREIEDVFFEKVGDKYFQNPELALTNYVQVMMEEVDVVGFLKSHKKPGVVANERNLVTMLNLLEMMRLSMAMNTSCAWFYNSIQRIEPVISFVCADSALELLKELAPAKGTEVEQNFLRILESVHNYDGGKNAFLRSKEANHTNGKASPSQRKAG